MSRPAAVVIRECRNGIDWTALDSDKIPSWMTRDIIERMFRENQMVHDDIDGADIYYRAQRVLTQADNDAIAAANAKRAARCTRNQIQAKRAA